jgi:hypothetical protein
MDMDILRDPIWQTVGVIVTLVLALTGFIGFVLSNPTSGREKAKIIIIVSAISIFVCAVILGIIIVPQLQKIISANIPPSRSPTQVLTTYCNAMKSGDAHTAWDQLSSDVQKKTTESAFAASFSSGSITNCTVKNVNDKSGFGTLTVKTANNTTDPVFGFGGDGDYQYTMIIDNGEWKINTVCEFLPKFNGACFTPK